VATFVHVWRRRPALCAIWDRGDAPPTVGVTIGSRTLAKLRAYRRASKGWPHWPVGRRLSTKDREQTVGIDCLAMQLMLRTKPAHPFVGLRSAGQASGAAVARAVDLRPRRGIRARPRGLPTALQHLRPGARRVGRRARGARGRLRRCLRGGGGGGGGAARPAPARAAAGAQTCAAFSFGRARARAAAAARQGAPVEDGAPVTSL
jgi:hypothetical protein